MEKLLIACKELKDIYEHPIQYDEFQYEFLLDSAIQDVIQYTDELLKE